MEIKTKQPVWLEQSHPNFVRWQNGRLASEARGNFAKQIISLQRNCKNLVVLDLGSGEGGTAKVFSQDNALVSFDISLVRLLRQNNSKDFHQVNGNGLILPFKDALFDLIIIQDVIEHLSEIDNFYSEVKRVLRIDGIIYLSTPNKFSIFNFISDPHFGLPIVSILKREKIKKYLLKYFRKEDYNRTDIAQLLSLKELIELFQNDFEISLYTKFSVQELFKGNKGIVWSQFHLALISICKSIKLDRLLIKIANDRMGFLNTFFTPTFYILIIKKEEQ